jgi:tetratricopeptide (TPR) repeat protein
MRPRMPDESSSALRAAYAALDARLSDPGATAERDAIKSDITALYLRVEHQAARLEELKQDITRLIEQWKALPVEPSTALASQPGHARTVYADHIGASTLVEKGWSLIARGDAAGAERALARALELSPNDPSIESLLGWAQMLQANYDGALARSQSVLAREPLNALARTNLGYICLKKGIFGEAIEHLSKVIRLDNDRKATLYAHFYLGVVYLQREMYADAENFFRRALALGPNLVEVYYELGRAMWFDGRREQAMQMWRQGGVANKFNPWAERCRELLKRVEAGGAPSRAC